VYLSNTEKEALQLTGYGDVPPWAVEQALEQALAKGTYVPGEEAVRLRLAEQMDLEERLATEQQAEQAQSALRLESDDREGVAEQLDWEDKETIGEEERRLLVVQRWMERGPLDAMQRMYADQVYGNLARLHQTSLERLNEMAMGWGQGIAEETDDAAATGEATADGQEAAEEPPAGPWRSPLEIVTEGAEEVEQGGPDEEDAAPAAVAELIEDRDFSRFTKTQLVNFARDYFGVDLDRRNSRDELIATVQGLVDEANEKAV
jgi:hypothetical protein